ncbi:glyoxylate reductase/hydroxypyruvate reductase-like [Metopolophium dirhodum]|uniref:glyoxylate reductase/hydroxypyruvate reductase-like n=1 Tax=Metopolophium dirhodum TaxID=44670 RepID=UPI00298F4FFE|nr:glyoxylate reductase/hydroxypyruvate reductase-like [Metopolophium dirhodum]XP_060870335.1 glyoxylate reductase/hydroxypyruvate reductase-like [Metopolophium dirhodum]XP_060870336.1 glyoxylate reductase/hydroxypyruvate reductase-like [Metopolophium dirhodum]
MLTTMSRPKVLVVMKLVPEIAIDLLRKRFDVEVCDFRPVTRAEIMKKVPGKFAIFCSAFNKIDEELIKTAGPSLKVVGTISVGYDHVDLTAMKKYGVRLGNTPHVLTEAVAETTVGLLIATTRRFFEANHALKTGGWKDVTSVVWLNWMCGRGIRNSVVGIVGCGNIGTSIARKLKTFSISQLLYTSRTEKPAVKALGGKLVTIDELVEQSDFIILSIALNEDTKFIINRERIAKMKSHAVLVNIGRGGLIDQDALIEALQENRIGGAGLDVMTPEPLPLDSPLMKMDNVVLLPHIGSASIETRTEMAILTAKNIIAVLDNTAMPNEVQY